MNLNGQQKDVTPTHQEDNGEPGTQAVTYGSWNWGNNLDGGCRRQSGYILNVVVVAFKKGWWAVRKICRSLCLLQQSLCRVLRYVATREKLAQRVRMRTSETDNGQAGLFIWLKSRAAQTLLLKKHSTLK